MAVDMDDFWVFGYGSLMWNPGFAFEDKMTARAFGYRRSLCVRSWVHRGTQERPGLVLGLDYGGSCRGMAFKVAPGDEAEVVDYLRERELVTHFYKERIMPAQKGKDLLIKIADGAGGFVTWRACARASSPSMPRPST